MPTTLKNLDGLKQGALARQSHQVLETHPTTNSLIQSIQQTINTTNSLTLKCLRWFLRQGLHGVGLGRTYSGTASAGIAETVDAGDGEVDGTEMRTGLEPFKVTTEKSSSSLEETTGMTGSGGAVSGTARRGWPQACTHSLAVWQGCHRPEASDQIRYKYYALRAGQSAKVIQGLRVGIMNRHQQKM